MSRFEPFNDDELSALFTALDTVSSLAEADKLLGEVMVARYRRSAARLRRSVFKPCPHEWQIAADLNIKTCGICGKVTARFDDEEPEYEARMRKAGLKI